MQSADHSYCLHKMQTIVHIVFVTNIFVALAIAVTIFSPVSFGPVRVSVGLLVGMITGHRRILRLRPSSFLLSVLKSNSTVHYWYFYEQWLQMNIDFSNKVARSLHFYSYFNALLTLPASMRSRVYESVQRLSIRPSVCLIDRQQQRRVYCWAPGRQEIPIAPCASAQQQRCRSTALSSKCGQRHVDSWRRICSAHTNNRLLLYVCRPQKSSTETWRWRLAWSGRSFFDSPSKTSPLKVRLSQCFAISHFVVPSKILSRFTAFLTFTINL